MKTNRFFISLISILLCLMMCSCSNKIIYENNFQTSLNYNNISAGVSPYWIDNNGVYFKEHNFAFDIYKIDKKGKAKIASVSEPSSNIQVYKNNLYYFESSNNKYIFKKYSLINNEKKDIATIKSERIYNYFILENSLFVVEGFNDNLIKNISVISLESGEKTDIEKNIIASGITNDALHYITKNNNKYTIYKYNAEKIELASFVLDEKDGEIIESVNFTSNYILCVQSNTQSIIMYDFATKTIDTCSPGGLVEEIIAFENNAFYVCDESGKSVVYCLNINTKEKTKIQDFNGDIDLFVASDENVYLSSTEFEGIQRYSIEGDFENILVS